jgi:hypothetical protein
MQVAVAVVQYQIAQVPLEELEEAEHRALIIVVLEFLEPLILEVGVVLVHINHVLLAMVVLDT